MLWNGLLMLLGFVLLQGNASGWIGNWIACLGEGQFLAGVRIAGELRMRSLGMLLLLAVCCALAATKTRPGRKIAALLPWVLCGAEVLVLVVLLLPVMEAGWGPEMLYWLARTRRMAGVSCLLGLLLGAAAGYLTRRMRMWLPVVLMLAAGLMELLLCWLMMWVLDMSVASLGFGMGLMHGFAVGLPALRMLRGREERRLRRMLHTAGQKTRSFTQENTRYVYLEAYKQQKRNESQKG